MHRALLNRQRQPGHCSVNGVRTCTYPHSIGTLQGVAQDGATAGPQTESPLDIAVLEGMRLGLADDAEALACARLPIFERDRHRLVVAEPHLDAEALLVVIRTDDRPLFGDAGLAM